MELSFKYCLQVMLNETGIPDDDFSLSWSNGATLKQDTRESGTYSIVCRSVHDGTLLFTHALISRAMEPLFEQTSYDKRAPPREGEVPHYTIGRISLNHITEYDKPKHMKWPTMCEEITIPVKVEWRNRC